MVEDEPNLGSGGMAKLVSLDFHRCMSAVISRVLLRIICLLLTASRCSLVADEVPFLATTSTSFTGARTVVRRNALVHSPRRVRRHMYEKKTGGLTYVEEMILLQKHNEYRRLQNASNMLIMQWNDDLRDRAQEWSDRCVYKHSDKAYRKDIGGFENLGENLYAGNLPFELTLPVKLWYDEIADYDFSTTRCTPQRMCGHYTQVVWYSSYAVGCGVTYCENLQQSRIPSAYYVVCHYGPAGNYIFKRPFKKGKACSDCPEKAVHCLRGLCSFRPQIGSQAADSSPQVTFIVLSLAASLIITMWSTRPLSPN